MAFVVDVLIKYRGGDIEEERTQAVSIEQDVPPSRAEIQAEVEAVAPGLVSRTLYHNIQAAFEPFTFTWEIQGVYEIP